MNKVYEIKLNINELLLIDGKVSEEAQKVIDRAKKEASFGFELPVMNEILRKSEKSGKLTWRYKEIRSCNYCDKEYDYYKYPRNTKYHKKDSCNFNKPKYYRGIKFNEEFFSMQGSGDMCISCAEKYNVINKLIDYIIDNDLKIEIQKNDYKNSKYIKDDILICYSCKKKMRESEMGKSQTLMGDGTYPSTCPHCGKKSGLFAENHERTNKFKMILNPAFGGEILVKKLKDEIKAYNEKNNERIELFEIYNKPNHYIIHDNNTNIDKRIFEINIEKKNFKKSWGYNEKYEGFIEILEKYNYDLVQ